MYSNGGWVPVGQAPQDQVHKIIFALKQQNLKILEQTALEVSDPTHPRYGKYLTTEEVLDIVAPPAHYAREVQDFVLRHCELELLETFENHRDAVVVSAPISCIERMFQIQLAVFKHLPTGHTVIRRNESGPLPDYSPISEYTQFVSGLHGFPPIRDTLRKPEKLNRRDLEQDAYDYVIPQTIKTQYNIPQNLTVTNERNIQAVIEYLPIGIPIQTDLTTYAKSIDMVFTPITKFIGPVQNNGNNGESTLDVELITNVASKATTWYITIGDGWMYETALTLFTMKDAPLVNSISYGWPEEYNCQSSVTNANCTGLDAQTYTLRANNEFAKLVAKGISVIVADQDEGAPSEANLYCSLDQTHPVFAIYPASSPWVTAVSASTIVSQSTSTWVNPPICSQGYTCSHGGEEFPCTVNNTYFQWTTGGGFSAYGEQPAWQKTQVEEYLRYGKYPPTKFFNSTNRAYPDITAVGARILVTMGGATTISAGTSASTPIIAGIVTLLNDYRLNKGKPALGFLNPLLYQMGAKYPAAFNDIQQGDNRCTEGSCCTYGYYARKGFDVPTGWGTPNFEQMLNYLKQM